MTKDDFEQNVDKQGKKKKVKRKKIFIRLLFVLFIFTFILAIGALLLRGHLFPLISRVFFNPFPGKKDIYVLVLGLDQNWTDKNIMHTKGARSDTIMLAHLNLEKKTAGLLSIPRDSDVEIPGYYKSKINEAHALGGPELSEKTVEKLLGIKIDYYIVVKTKALPELIDSIGGVEVFVDKDMDYDDNWGHLHIHLKEGWQIVDGDRAVQFSRFRKDAEGDLARIRRQQQVLYAIKSKIAGSSKNVFELQKLVGKISKNIETNLSTPQMLHLITTYRHLDMGSIKMGTVPTYGEDINGVSYQLVDEQNLPEYIKKYLLDI